MFNGFKSKYVKVKKGKVFCRVGGEGPPLLLLHGYPQTHLMWHKTAPELSKRFTVVAADLRGYGNSLAPASDSKHYNYSKREMASDMKQMMIKLGFNKFFVAGHDRGGRVAHRLARDHRKNIIALSVLDICPTLDMPVQVLWGSNGVIGKQFKPIKIWQRYTQKKVIGYPINSGHFIPEQNPKATIKHLTDFFLKKIK